VNLGSIATAKAVAHKIVADFRLRHSGVRPPARPETALKPKPRSSN
jgi:hypothetical protein